MAAVEPHVDTARLASSSVASLFAPWFKLNVGTSVCSVVSFHIYFCICLSYCANLTDSLRGDRCIGENSKGGQSSLPRTPVRVPKR
jgi:hypothetical protein